jgi:hypothetical protein
LSSTRSKAEAGCPVIAAARDGASTKLGRFQSSLIALHHSGNASSYSMGAQCKDMVNDNAKRDAFLATLLVFAQFQQFQLALD